MYLHSMELNFSRLLLVRRCTDGLVKHYVISIDCHTSTIKIGEHL